MKKGIVIFLLSILVVMINNTTFAQTKDDVKIYNEAFAEQLKMLTGEVPLSFKRAVFLTENAYHKGKLNYMEYCNEISTTGKKLKMLIKERGLERYKTSGNWAVFTYMTDSLPINNYCPYSYDFTDFAGKKDWTSMFVTKLIKTKTGNCHSLPILYKILCEEIGAEAYLALAPNHLYIKHIDENGKWVNIELTNGSFARDQWIIQQMSISVEAIKSGAYMKELSDKESIVLAMNDLILGYINQFGYDKFVLNSLDIALKYHPNDISLWAGKSNYYNNLREKEIAKPKPDKNTLKQIYFAYKECNNKIDSLGYQDMPKELYDEWVKSVEKEKQKRAVVK